MFFCFKRPTFLCSPKTIMCIGYPVICPRNFLSSLSRVKNCNCTYGSSKLERDRKIVCKIKGKPETAVFQRNKQKLSLNNCSLRKGDWNKRRILWGRRLEQHVGETVKKFAELSFPTPYWGIGTCYQGTLLPKLRIGWGKPVLFWLSLSQEWVWTASIRSSASQATQGSN